MLVQEHALSVVQACQIARLSRTAWYRPSQDMSAKDQPVIDALLALVDRHSRWGFWLCYDRLRALGHPWNAKRVYRVYCALRLNLKRRRKKRVQTPPRLALHAPAILNGTWALDFMGDTLYDGRCYRTLNVLDEGSREALAIEVDTSLPSRRVVQLLEQLVMLHGAPAMRANHQAYTEKSVLTLWDAPLRVSLRQLRVSLPRLRVSLPQLRVSLLQLRVSLVLLRDSVRKLRN